MALREISRLSKFGWFTVLQSNSPDIGVNDGWRSPSASGQAVYYEVFDQLWARYEALDNFGRSDPLILDTSYGAGNANLIVDSVGKGAGVSGIFVGEFNVATNSQRMYAYVNAGLLLLFEVDPNDLLTQASPDFTETNWRTAGINLVQSGGTVDTQGYRELGTTAGVVIFESAEPATWPAGYMLQAGCTFWDDDGGGLAEHDHCLVQVDLADEGGSTGPPSGNGRAIIVPTANYFTGSPTHDTAHSGPLGGFEVHFDQLEFIGDGDNTPAAPKGRLFMFNHNKSSTGASNPHRVGGGSVAVGSIMNKFIKVIEWNPTEKAATTGNVSRTHLRQLLLTLCTFTEETPLASGGIGESNSPPSTGFETETGFYHPPTDTVRFRWNSEPGAAENDYTEIVFALAAAVDGLTIPAARGRTETGKVITFGSTALGDLGERISLVDVDWTLTRRSTEGELLTNSGSGGTATVEAAEIDGLSDTDNSLVLYEDGTPQTEGVDYTVDISTGIITSLAPNFEAGKVYTCDYDHRDVPLTPPHAILRTTTSKTDADGEAICRVEIPNDATLEGEFDALGVAEMP